jgi:hypothetical protein
MILQIQFTDGSSKSINYREAEPMFDSESHNKIKIINEILEKTGKTWDDILRIKEINI